MAAIGPTVCLSWVYIMRTLRSYDKLHCPYTIRPENHGSALCYTSGNFGYLSGYDLWRSSQHWSTGAAARKIFPSY